MLTSDRFLEILEGFPRVRLAVFGDFFLDKYLVIDPVLAEVSLETGLEAWQVVGMRSSPGAAGTVTNNLAALEIGSIVAVGAIGDDGNGYELRQGLQRTGVDMEHLLVLDEIFTPTYTKPMVITEDGGECESNRVDIKNRRPLSEAVQERLIEELLAVLGEVEAVIVADQVEEPHLGVVTDWVRGRLAEIAAEHPDKVFFADSRASIAAFRNMVIKPNAREAALCLEGGLEARTTPPAGEGGEPSGLEAPPTNEGGERASEGGEPAIDAESAGPVMHDMTPADLGMNRLAEMGRELAARNGRPVYVTLGAEGMLVCTAEGAAHVPGFPVEGPTDICGAGDSATAGIVSALCAGATYEEAAVFGNLVASITVQQIGTTGTASPTEVLSRYIERSDS